MKALPLLLFFWAATAVAFRGRPVNDLRFDDRGECAVRGIASDGTSALSVCIEDSGAHAQLIRDNGRVDPAFLIAGGTVDVAVSWNGTAYVVAAASAEGLWITTVSRGGGTTSFRKFRSDRFERVGIASNGGRTLVVAAGHSEDLGFLLDSRAEPIGPAIRLGGALSWQVAPLGTGFAFAQFGALTTISRIDRDGTNAGATTIDAGATLIAGGGPRLLILYPTRTAMMNVDGTIERNSTTFARQITAAAWTGREYLAVGANGTMRISASGDVIGSSNATNGQPTAIAALTDRALIASASSFGTIRNGAVTLDGPLTQLGRRVNAHEAFDIAATNGEYLAAWIEHHGDTATARASRIDRTGVYLDGPGLLLGATPRKGPHGISVTSDGTNWLVAWADGNVHAVRIARDGRMLDAQPTDLGEGFDVDVLWGKSTYVVAVASGVTWSTFTLSATGVASARRIIAEGIAGDSRGSGRVAYGDVKLSFDGSVFLAIANEAHTGCDPVAPVCGTTRYVSAIRLDATGAPLDPPLLRFFQVTGEVEVAGGNGLHLLLMPQFVQLSESPWTGDHYVTAMMHDGWLPPIASPRLRLPRGHSPSVAWNGREFVAAWMEAGTQRIQIARITEAGLIDGPRTMANEDGELAFAPRLASGVGSPTLLGYLNPNPATDGVPRLATIFTSEIEAQPLVPQPPSNVTAQRIGSDVRVRWSAVANAWGIDIELATAGGGHRRIGTVSGTATEARVPLEYAGDAIRLRAWNRSGTSAPSAEAWISGERSRSVRK